VFHRPQLHKLRDPLWQTNRLKKKEISRLQ
jgi:hypothetical protein